jgi:hypothetical protein
MRPRWIECENIGVFNPDAEDSASVADEWSGSVSFGDTGAACLRNVGDDGRQVASVIFSL